MKTFIIIPIVFIFLVSCANKEKFVVKVYSKAEGQGVVDTFVAIDTIHASNIQEARDLSTIHYWTKRVIACKNASAILPFEFDVFNENGTDVPISEYLISEQTRYQVDELRKEFDYYEEKNKTNQRSIYK